MKKLILLLALLLIPTALQAQTTTVTGTFTDASSQALAYGSVRIDFVPISGGNVYICGGVSFNPNTYYIDNLDNTGSFSQVLTLNTACAPAGSQWRFTACPSADTPCSSAITSINTSPTQDVSSLITIPTIQVPAQNYKQPKAYADSEIVGPVPGFTYWNLSLNTLRVCQGPLPCTWVSVSGGGVSCSGTSGQLLWLSGTSCVGVAGSSVNSAGNVTFSTATGVTVTNAGSSDGSDTEDWGAPVVSNGKAVYIDDSGNLNVASRTGTTLATTNFAFYEISNTSGGFWFCGIGTSGASCAMSQVPGPLTEPDPGTDVFGFNTSDQFECLTSTNISCGGLFESMQLVNLSGSGTLCLDTNNSGQVGLFTLPCFNPAIPGPIGGTTPNTIAATSVSATSYTINGKCISTANPAVCGSSSGGFFVIAVSAGTVVIDTTAVLSNSIIGVAEDDSIGPLLGVTCNSAGLTGNAAVVQRPPASTGSFTFGVANAPSTNPFCFSWLIQ